MKFAAAREPGSLLPPAALVLLDDPEVGDDVRLHLGLRAPLGEVLRRVGEERGPPAELLDRVALELAALVEAVVDRAHDEPSDELVAEVAFELLLALLVGGGLVVEADRLRALHVALDGVQEDLVLLRARVT